MWSGGPGWLGRFHNGTLDLVGAKEGYTAAGGYAFCELPDGRLMAGGKDKLLEFDGRAWKVVIGKLDRVRDHPPRPRRRRLGRLPPEASSGFATAWPYSTRRRKGWHRRW